MSEPPRAAGAQRPPSRIEARGWGFRHAGRRSWAVRGLDLVVEPGERVLLVGPSGAGKSTLLLALGGLLDSRGGGEQEGQLLVDGLDPRAARDRTGLLFQDPESQIILGRAGDDVAFGLENRCVPADEIWPLVDDALRAVEFPYGRDRPTHALSGGELQRLALAGTIALAPSLLLLDEPTANLDPDGADAVRAALGRAVNGSGATVVLVEHRVDEAIPLVDRVLALDADGAVMADGRPADVFREHGAALAEAGIWVPDHPPAAPVRRDRPAARPLVLAEHAGFRYPGAMAPAISGIDLQLKSSEALAIVGPNGSGKSTLALLLAGLLDVDAGRVVATEALRPGHGLEALASWPADVLVRHVGTVFQDPEHQFLASTVRDELLLGPRRAGVPQREARARVDELLERLHLGALSAANPFTLSGGEKRRLSVATALATAPDLLVLDEPTYGQDRRTWTELLHLLAGLRDEGRGICFVTHDRPFAHALADRTFPLPEARG
ncbi:MAG: energy-coupling factor ABC transporter ATP-binding protein [Chloroflexi bacterium]|nr:energy-coupling factor ABC transporter ATP-binding protein [Chloroflexota bacterium]